MSRLPGPFIPLTLSELHLRTTACPLSFPLYTRAVASGAIGLSISPEAWGLRKRAWTCDGIRHTRRRFLDAGLSHPCGLGEGFDLHGDPHPTNAHGPHPPTTTTTGESRSPQREQVRAAHDARVFVEERRRAGPKPKEKQFWHEEAIVAGARGRTEDQTHGGGEQASPHGRGVLMQTIRQRSSGETFDRSRGHRVSFGAAQPEGDCGSIHRRAQLLAVVPNQYKHDLRNSWTITNDTTIRTTKWGFVSTHSS